MNSDDVTNTNRREDPHRTSSKRKPIQSVIVRQHSPVLYWWPVWLVGFLFAALSFFFGEQIQVGGQTMWLHPSRNLGVIFVTVFGVVFFSSFLPLRGLMPLLAFFVVLFCVTIIAMFGWWDDLFSFEQHLSIHMDAGFYLVFSLFLFTLWVGTIFVGDRLKSCEFRPGQLIVRNLVTEGVRTFSTHGMSLYKVQDARFRHWILGLGTGDLHVATTGAEAVKFDIRNVTSIDRKMKTIKKLVAMSPDDLSET